MCHSRDLTDEQWKTLDPLIPKPRTRSDGRGRPWKSRRSVINGILWVLRTGAVCDEPEESSGPEFNTCSHEENTHEDEYPTKSTLVRISGRSNQLATSHECDCNSEGNEHFADNPETRFHLLDHWSSVAVHAPHSMLAAAQTVVGVTSPFHSLTAS
jgi:Putative transposase of IS4/5 family (DUF4096)